MVLDPAAGTSFPCLMAPKLSTSTNQHSELLRSIAWRRPGGGVVAKLSVDGAEFWLSGEALGGGSVRMILTVADPDAFFAQALTAGDQGAWLIRSGFTGRLVVLSSPRRSSR